MESSFISMLIKIRIWIQGAEPMRIHAAPDPDPGQTSKSQKLNFYMKQKPTYEGTKAFSVVHFHAPGFGSGSAFQIRIRIWIQDSKINADQCLSGSTAQNWYLIFKNGPNTNGNKCWISKSKSLTGLESSVSEPDWIQIQSGQWIRIQEGKNDT